LYSIITGESTARCEATLQIKELKSESLLREYTSGGNVCNEIILEKDLLIFHESHLQFLRLKRYPVHCAVMGGNLQLLRWLVETHGCPLFVKSDSMTGSKQSLRTTGNKSLIDLAMTGKPKLDILHYLVITHNMSVDDTTNPRMALRSLDALLREKDTDKKHLQASKEEPALIDDYGSEISTGTIEDAVSVTSFFDVFAILYLQLTTSFSFQCTLCQERNMDCVMTPCGHQLCCHECGLKLSFCPTCKVSCTVLKIYRQT
jgi:Zinc finger, C3HC4 type (RING finger)